MNEPDLMLIRPSKAWEAAIWAYRQEYLDHGETRINGSCGLGSYRDFDQWLALAQSIVRDKLSRDQVHASTFFSMRKSDGRIVGSIQLRHFLTPELERHGGHVGYGIRPTERSKGYGTQQLMLVMDIAGDMEIPRLLISCDKDNAASSRTILSCGGTLKEESLYEGIMQQVFWIDLA